MATRVVFDAAFGPKDSFCFNYADPLKATSSNLPLKVKALFEKDRDPPVTEISCLALGPNVRWAVVYRSQERWYISELTLHSNANCADKSSRSGRELATKIERVDVNRIRSRRQKERCWRQDCHWS